MPAFLYGLGGGVRGRIRERLGRSIKLLRSIIHAHTHSRHICDFPLTPPDSCYPQTQHRLLGVTKCPK